LSNSQAVGPPADSSCRSVGNGPLPLGAARGGGWVSRSKGQHWIVDDWISNLQTGRKRDGGSVCADSKEDHPIDGVGQVLNLPFRQAARQGRFQTCPTVSMAGVGVVRTDKPAGLRDAKLPNGLCRASRRRGSCWTRGDAIRFRGSIPTTRAGEACLFIVVQ